MKFLENLSEFTGGARGGLGALGEMLSLAALGEANARPGEGTGTGAARGFAQGAVGLPESFARGRGMRDKERVRSMAMKKLEDPNLGPAERDLYTAIASGNTAALDLFDETLAARASDRGDRAEAAKLAYYEAKNRGLMGAKAPTSAEVAAYREITAMRRQFIERPEAFGEIDLSNPDNDLLRSRQIAAGYPDPLGELYIEWAGLDPLMRDRVPFQEMVKGRYGQEGLSILASDYGIDSSEMNPSETGGDVADVAASPQGGPADAIVDGISGIVGGPGQSFWDTGLGGMVDSLFGTRHQGRQGRQTQMQGLLGELEAAALGQDPTAPASNSPLIPEDQIDSAFQAVTGGRGGPDLMRREDELRSSTGPSSRLDGFMTSLFPNGMPGEASAFSNPSGFIQGINEFESAVGQIPGQIAKFRSDFSSAIGRAPGDFMQGLRRASEGNYTSEPIDAYGAGVKAREDFGRAMSPITRRMQPYSNLSPTDQQERERFLRSLGWGG